VAGRLVTAEVAGREAEAEAEGGGAGEGEGEEEVGIGKEEGESRAPTEVCANGEEWCWKREVVVGRCSGVTAAEAAAEEGGRA
jgi:hypothetical protein